MYTIAPLKAFAICPEAIFLNLSRSEQFFCKASYLQPSKKGNEEFFLNDLSLILLFIDFLYKIYYVS